MPRRARRERWPRQRRGGRTGQAVAHAGAASHLDALELLELRDRLEEVEQVHAPLEECVESREKRRVLHLPRVLRDLLCRLELVRKVNRLEVAEHLRKRGAASVATRRHAARNVRSGKSTGAHGCARARAAPRRRRAAFRALAHGRTLSAITSRSTASLASIEKTSFGSMKARARSINALHTCRAHWRSAHVVRGERGLRRHAPRRPQRAASATRGGEITARAIICAAVGAAPRP